jgi:choline dehydrogenase-like flavoprotein
LAVPVHWWGAYSDRRCDEFAHAVMNVLIIGAGPAAAGVAIALAKNPEIKIQVLDVGGRLEEANEVARDRMSQSDPDAWQGTDLKIISQTAVAGEQHGLPEKRIFGSDFPFRNFGQLDGVSAQSGFNSHVISGAYGGFSNTWGAQTMVFSEATFDDWPFSRSELESDYRAVLAEMPYSGEQDDLAEYFPLWGDADALPKMSEAPERILRNYERNRLKVRRQGVLVGKARLAMRGSSCVSCGLCMTGCPYSLVYSASQTFDELVKSRRVEYVAGYVALQLGEADGQPFVEAKSLATERIEAFRADKIFVACGALGTTRLVAHSLGQWSRRIHLSESSQFLVPFVSPRGIKQLSQDGSFTLNQFNMVLPFDEAGHDVVQIHGYPYNDAMDDALPNALQSESLHAVRSAILKRTTVGLGYLPSWWSPGFDVLVSAPQSEGRLPEMQLTPSSSQQELTKPMLREVIKRLVKVAPYLGVAPAVPQIELFAPTKSYHFGGSFPHARSPVDGETDVLGRVQPWQSIHLVDASVFPTVPATTFTLTIMANAHRIARRVVEGERA